jgi:hypothetical protein
VPWGHRGRANVPNLHPHAKKKQKETASGTTRRPSLQRSDFKQELDQEATSGRRNFFHRSIRSNPKLQLLVRLDNEIPSCFC